MIIGLLSAGRFLGNGFLSSLSLLGTVALPLYLARSQIVSVLTGSRRIFSSGLLAMALAFATLPLAYFMSVLKKRRRV
jgi:hypothetical protein